MTLNFRNIFKANNDIFDFYKIVDTIAEPGIKGTVIGAEFLYSLANNRYRSGFTSLSPLPERLGIINYGQVFPSFSPFFDTFNVKILQMYDTGFCQLWNKGIVQSKDVIKRVEEIGPEVLTLEHLDIAFKIILVAIAISLISFLAEIAFHRITRTVKPLCTKLLKKFWSRLDIT